MRPVSDEAERFQEKVEYAVSGCHEWRAGINRGGYGKLWFRGKSSVAAHRVAYELFVSPIPNDAHVLHRCDNRKYVNPAHLFLGTAQDNITDMDTKGRRGTRRKLRGAVVVAVKKLIADGVSQQSIANRYGINQRTVSRIKRATN